MMVLFSITFMTLISLVYSWGLLELGVLILVLLGLNEILSFSLGYSLKNSLMYVDDLALLLVVLTFLIIFLMLKASYTSVKLFNKSSMLFGVLLSSMAFFLVVTFMSSGPLMFYVMFEASLIPIFLLIMGWGSQPERLKAGLYMLFYTLFASLPLLIVILIESESFNNFMFFSSIDTVSVFDVLLTFMFIFAFLVKFPMYMVHLWLPKAHVEAPVAGSMILAGVLLKLGSYGLWRVMFFTGESLLMMAAVFMSIGLIGGVIASFVCSVQVDMKSLVAFSSVVHMGILLGGMMSMSLVGFKGALCMMVGHGVVSSCLFYLVGVNYDRFSNRSVLLNKGMMIIFPSLTIMWFMACIFNISAPPSISLLSEILLTSGILMWSFMLFIWLMLMNFMSMVYTFYLYSQTQQGKFFFANMSVGSAMNREYLVGWSHNLIVLSMVLFFFLF